MAPARRAARAAAIVFAGERRVWLVAGLCALPLLGLIAFYMLRPIDYDTGSNNVEVSNYVAPVAPGQALCLPGLEIPPGTARLRFIALSRTQQRPTLRLALSVGGEVLHSRIGAVRVPNPISAAVFTVPGLDSRAGPREARACLTAGDVVNWGGTPLQRPLLRDPPSVGGVPLSSQVAVWYQPPQGAQSSYLARIGAILERAALFRPAPIGAWLYAILLVLLLPALTLLAVRQLAVAASGRPPRRLALSLFLLAALNFVSWSLISPPFQAPDEVDHFAYTQSLVERGTEPSRDPASPLLRWSNQEGLLLEHMSFATDHQIGDTTVPWLPLEQRRWEAAVASLHPSAANGGGNETAATHGPIYYAALAPAYLLGGGSPLSQLTLMRIVSALIGALTVLFTFLMVRELAPGRPWLAVLAALLVTFQPMYGFISGAINNDVGVNAGAAALELLLIRILRRGLTVPTALLTGAVLALLPLVKGTGLSLYPVAALVLAIALVRDGRDMRGLIPGARSFDGARARSAARERLRGWAALVGAGVALYLLAPVVFGVWAPPAAAGGAASVGSNASAASEALHHLAGYASYVWQVFLPKLPFMHAHFLPGTWPAFEIFVERGWAAFGWYTVIFPHRVYRVIEVVMLAAIPIALWAARREWPWLRRNWRLAIAVLAMPICVFLGFEAAYYSSSIRPLLAEFGRYEFPAIGPLAAIVVGALHAFGRRHALTAGVVVLVAMIAFSYASQLLTLTTFYG